MTDKLDPPTKPTPHAFARTIRPIYGCAAECCAIEVSWPADDLWWVDVDGEPSGFYCDNCIDEISAYHQVNNDDGDDDDDCSIRGISLAKALAELTPLRTFP